MTSRSLLAACLAGMLLLTTHARAWDNTTGGSGPQAIGDSAPAQAQSAHAASRSTAAAASRSASRSRSSATGGAGGSVVVNNSAGGDPAAGDPSGGGWGGRFPVATAYAPGFGNANNCGGQALSGGAQTSILGLTLGGQRMDVYCQIERLGNLATPAQKIDFAYQCRERGDDFRAAAADAGFPCPGDRGKVEPVAARAPAAVPTEQKGPSDFCFTASPGERRQYRECRGVKYE